MQAPTRREQRQTHPARRTQRRAQDQAAGRQRRIVTIAAAAIALVVVALVAARLLMGSTSAAAPNEPAPDALVGQVTGVDAATLEQVGRGTASALPAPVRAPIEQGPDGKPLITYVGAEYCPFCAAQRWPLILALSRFGTFSGLELSHSASDDVFPNTPTFSFVGSTYASPYLDFSPVELQSNVRSGSGYQTLQTPTPLQTSVLQKYDAAPYVPAQSAGSIPFIDFAGQYVLAGSSYDASVLRGMTQEQVASALSDPSSPQAKAILGSANALTAAICSATGDQPAEVCSAPTIQSLAASLSATPAPAKG